MKMEPEAYLMMKHTLTEMVDALLKKDQMPVAMICLCKDPDGYSLAVHPSISIASAQEIFEEIVKTMYNPNVEIIHMNQNSKSQ